MEHLYHSHDHMLKQQRINQSKPMPEFLVNVKDSHAEMQTMIQENQAEQGYPSQHEKIKQNQYVDINQSQNYQPMYQDDFWEYYNSFQDLQLNELNSMSEQVAAQNKTVTNFVDLNENYIVKYQSDNQLNTIQDNNYFSSLNNHIGVIKDWGTSFCQSEEFQSEIAHQQIIQESLTFSSQSNSLTEEDLNE
eukprot:403369907